jgi:hypothetical protein
LPGSRRLLASKWAEWIALALLLIVTAVKAAGPPTQPLNTLEMLQRDIIHWYVPIVAARSILAAAGRVGQWWFGAENKRRVKAVLDALDEACCRQQPEAERYYNRITLFKANRRKTRLVPYCRAGEQYQRGIQPFAIHDSDQEANEGMAGQAWFRAVTVTVNDLPAVPEKAEDWSGANEACKQYVRAGFLSHAKAARLRVKSRSILATPVRDFRGTKWGTLVLDCRNPGIINERIKDLAESTARVLGKML